MPKVPKGKEMVCVYIDEKLMKEFRKIAKEKYDKFKVLSLAVEEAIKMWVEHHKNFSSKQSAHTQKYSDISVAENNPPDIVYKTWLKVKYELVKSGHLHSASFNALVNAIEKVRGIDKRTIKKWIKLFEKYKLIKQRPNDFTWEII